MENTNNSNNNTNNGRINSDGGSNNNNSNNIDPLLPMIEQTNVSPQATGQAPGSVQGTVYMTEDGTDSYATTGVETCSICICICERLTANIPCGHTFCMECISHWLWDRRTCPLCRQPVEKTRYLIERPNGQMVWRICEYRRNPQSYPYVIQTSHELMIETFSEEDVYLFSPQFFRGKLHYRLMIIMENAHVIMSLPPVGSFLVTCQNLKHTIDELRARDIPLYNGARHLDGNRRHAPALTVHQPHTNELRNDNILDQTIRPTSAN